MTPKIVRRFSRDVEFQNARRLVTTLPPGTYSMTALPTGEVQVWQSEPARADIGINLTGKSPQESVREQGNERLSAGGTPAVIKDTIAQMNQRGREFWGRN